MREVVDHSLGNVTVTGRDLQAASVRYTGRVFADSPDGPLSRAFTLTITRRARDSRVLLDVNVPGVDAVALHSFRRNGYVYRGVAPSAASCCCARGATRSSRAARTSAPTPRRPSRPCR